MNLIFSDQSLPTAIIKSIFLAGPSPRPKTGQTMRHWRHTVIKFLSDMDTADLTVFIPIPTHLFEKPEDVDFEEFNYDNQIKWECDARQMADKIVFWIPRSETMRGYTTNIEFGEDLHSGKMIYGRPDDAHKISYLDKRAEEQSLIIYNDLYTMLEATMDDLKIGALRMDGEAHIPLFIWQSPQFQNWYYQLKVENGNVLCDAKVLSFFKTKSGFLFSFTLWVNIWITEEKRFKSNEFVLFRTDISTIVPYYITPHDIKIVLVKEFRSTVNNPSGYVIELPSGSSAKKVSPLINAQHELKEETGIHIEDLSRFVSVGVKQLCATLSTHTASIYSVELTREEYQSVEKSIQEGKIFGVESDTERTTLMTISYKDMHKHDIDLSTIGMISNAMYYV